MSFEALRESLSSYQKAVRAAKTKYFSKIVSNNCHKPRILFGIINSVLNPPTADPHIAVNITSENLMKLFINKIVDIRSHIILFRF